MYFKRRKPTLSAITKRTNEMEHDPKTRVTTPTGRSTPLSECGTKVDEDNFILVFRHDSSNGRWFTQNEGLRAGTSWSDEKFSRLDSIASWAALDENGKMTFKLTYPEEQNTIIWKQSSNPATTYNEVIGYEVVDLGSDSDLTGATAFNGLALSSATTSTFLDGQPGHGNWYYAIGSYTAWGLANHFPGYRASGATAVQQAELYVKTSVEKWPFC